LGKTAVSVLKTVTALNGTQQELLKTTGMRFQLN